MNSTILATVAGVLALLPVGLLLLSGRRPIIALVGALVVFAAAFTLRAGVDRLCVGSHLRLPFALTPGAPLNYSVDPGPSLFGEETYLVCLGIGPESAARESG